jgi:hypothetical protein
MERRQNHPLVKLMKEIRKRHKQALIDVETCMQQIDPSLASTQMLKKIEEGLRELPGLLGGSGPPVSQWIQAWLQCVKATADERKAVEDLLTQIVLGQLEYDLPEHRSGS